MKKTQLLTAILMGAATVPGLSQIKGSTAYIKPVDDKRFAVYINEARPEKTDLFIKDLNGTTLYASKIKSNKSFAKVFNMAELDNGYYELILEDSKVIQTVPLKLSEELLTITNEESHTAYKPHLAHRDNYLDLMVFSPEKGRYEITIYDSNNSVIYNQALSNSLKIEKRFDISGLKPGKYNVMVTGEHGRFSYALPID